jgi:hypothetical protein
MWRQFHGSKESPDESMSMQLRHRCGVRLFKRLFLSTKCVITKIVNSSPHDAENWLTAPDEHQKQRNDGRVR